METVCIICFMTYENYKTYVSSRILGHSVIHENGCIEYRGDRKLKHRYGLVSITMDRKRKSVPAHRAMWMALNNRFDLPRGIVIRHKCDNPRCVNIDHLLEGTHKDNARDKLDRKRNAKRYCLHTRHVRFDDETILAIKNSIGKLKWVAEEFGTTPGYVSKLRNNKAKTLITP